MSSTSLQYKEIWEKVLRNSEEVKYEFSIAKNFRKWSLISATVISIPLVFLGGFGIVTFLIALFYYGYYLKVANAYAFTDKRIVIHRGWLSTSVVSIDYDKITDITVREGFLDRKTYHTGELVINTAGTIGSEIVLKHIEHPYEVKKKLDDLRS